MYEGDIPFISPRYKREDYKDLKLKIDSPKDTFDTAIAIFKDRIQARFINQIHLLANDWEVNGFAIMALDCLLIEALAQFRDGYDNYEGVSKTQYKKFLTTQFPNSFTSEDIAIKFYERIRCGILHQAQTKAGSGLTVGAPAVAMEDDFIMVSVDSFTLMLIEYFDKYCEELQDSNNDLLRSNFVKKMNFICDRW